MSHCAAYPRGLSGKSSSARFAKARACDSSSGVGRVVPDMNAPAMARKSKGDPS